LARKIIFSAAVLVVYPSDLPAICTARFDKLLRVICIPVDAFASTVE